MFLLSYKFVKLTWNFQNYLDILLAWMKFYSPKYGKLFWVNHEKLNIYDIRGFFKSLALKTKVYWINQMKSYNLFFELHLNSENDLKNLLPGNCRNI